MVTSALEINNSVCLNPGKEADTVLQDFLTHFDGAELQMFCRFKEEAHFFHLFFFLGSGGDTADPKVTSSLKIPDSVNCIVIAHFSEFSTGQANGHFCTRPKWIAADKSQDSVSTPINATQREVRYSGKSCGSCRGLWCVGSIFLFHHLTSGLALIHLQQR